MVDKIEVYVRNVEVVVESSTNGRSISDGYTMQYCTIRETLRREKLVSEADRATLEIVKKLAAEKDLIVDVYDVSTFRWKVGPV